MTPPRLHPDDLAAIVGAILAVADVHMTLVAFDRTTEEQADDRRRLLSLSQDWARWVAAGR